MSRAAITVGLLLITIGTSVAAGMSGDIVRGRQAAEQRCAGCHALGDSGDSPNRAAPPFRNLYRQYPVDALLPAFIRGLEVGHRDMPRFVLDPAEVADIVAFLHDINPCSKPASDDAAMAKCFAPME